MAALTSSMVMKEVRMILVGETEGREGGSGREGGERGREREGEREEREGERERGRGSMVTKLQQPRERPYITKVYNITSHTHQPHPSYVIHTCTALSPTGIAAVLRRSQPETRCQESRRQRKPLRYPYRQTRFPYWEWAWQYQRVQQSW